MTDTLNVKCPKCKKQDIEFNFAGNNGYVAMCATCKLLLYYCAIFGNVSYFKATGEEYSLQFSEMVFVK